MTENKLSSAPSAQIATDLRALYRQLKRQFMQHSGGSTLTSSQTAVVMQLDSIGSATASALARSEGMRPQSMRAILATLDEWGLIQSRPDPNDGRQVLVSLSEAGERWLAEGRAARQDWLTRQLASALSPAEQAEISNALKILIRTLDL